MKRLVLLVTTLLWLCMPAAAFAYNPLDNACATQGGAGKGSVACGTNGSDTITGQNGALRKATLLLATIAGVAAVIIVIVGGFMYVTSGGNSQRIEAAKNAIIGAIVGLVIIAAAASIITLVISKTG